MPKGLELFREKFSEHTDKYVLIGGTACELAMREAELEFRATKDLDIVLTVETLDPVFSGLFWDFVKAGGYEHQQNGEDAKPQFYRFQRPTDPAYPAQLELLSRRPDLLQVPSDRRIIRIRADDDDVASLSAIMMDDHYYALVQSGRRVVNGYSTLNAESLIPLKAKAFLDLTERRWRGDKVQSGDIKKHKLDVFRLSALLTDTTRVTLADSVRGDFDRFVKAMPDEDVDPKALGLGDRKKDQILATLSTIYQL
jgi:hypothetical protein